MKIHIKNQLNTLTVEFCCGEKEYRLGPGEVIAINIQDEDCMYFDTVSPNKDVACPLIERITKLEEQADFIRRRDMVYE